MRSLLLLTLSACQTAAPLGPVPSTDPTGDYAALLERVVTPRGYVKWSELKADHEALDHYVAWLSRPGAEPSDEMAAHAIWLNAYNAWVLKGVLEAGTPASVKDVPGWIPVGGSGFFIDRTWSLAGAQVSLYNAEHGIIRPRFKDWRDHAALNCASASCPPLRRELFAAHTLDQQLDDQAARWVNDPIRGMRITEAGLVVSPIFEWYAADFEQDLCAQIAPFAQPDLATALHAASGDECTLSTFEYDWRLNKPEVASAALSP